jgi:hypothetical protein
MNRIKNFIKNEGPVIFFAVLILAQVGCNDKKNAAADPAPPAMVGLWQASDDAKSTAVSGRSSRDACAGFVITEDEDTKEKSIDFGYMEFAADGSAYYYEPVKKSGELTRTLGGHINSQGILTYTPEIQQDMLAFADAGITVKSMTNVITLTEDDELNIETTTIISFAGIEQEPQVEKDSAVRGDQATLDTLFKNAQACLNKR